MGGRIQEKRGFGKGSGGTSQIRAKAKRAKTPVASKTGHPMCCPFVSTRSPSPAKTKPEPIPVRTILGRSCTEKAVPNKMKAKISQLNEVTCQARRSTMRARPLSSTLLPRSLNIGRRRNLSPPQECKAAVETSDTMEAVMNICAVTIYSSSVGKRLLRNAGATNNFGVSRPQVFASEDHGPPFSRSSITGASLAKRNARTLRCGRPVLFPKDWISGAGRGARSGSHSGPRPWP